MGPNVIALSLVCVTPVTNVNVVCLFPFQIVSCPPGFGSGIVTLSLTPPSPQSPNLTGLSEWMASSSCDDEFGLLGDETHHHIQHHHNHHHHHHHHQQQQQQQQTPVPFALRYVNSKAAAGGGGGGGGGVSIHSRPLHPHPPPPPPPPISPKNNSSQVGESYGEAFVNPHHHCFAAGDDDHGFTLQSQEQDVEEEEEEEEDDDGDGGGGGGDQIPRRDDEAAAAHHHTPSVSISSRQQQQQQHLDLPKRKDHEEQMSDGESPSSYYNKKARSNPAMAILPSSSSGGGGGGGGGGAGDYRKDREEWSDSAIACLLDAYTDKYIQLNRGNLRGRDWEDVATIVSERCDSHKSGKSVEQCKNKVDNLKKRYKVECQRLSSGSHAVSHWPWFKKMEQIVGSSSSKPITDDDKAVTLSGTGATSTARQLKRYSVAAPSSTTLANNFKMKSVSNPRWKRAVLKISGAALAGSGPHNVDPKVIMLIAKEVANAIRFGVEVAIVVGGRNFFCGDTWVAATGTDRATAYQIGMMASAMNSLLLQASLEKIGVETRVQTAFMMQEIAEPYIRRRAIRHLEKGRVVIFGGIGAGMGNPDTAAALRAAEINADVLLKGTNMESSFECHSRTNAVAFEHISFGDTIARGFTAMDRTAISICEENNIPVVFFNVLEPGNISRALCGDQVGTLIDQSGRNN